MSSLLLLIFTVVNLIGSAHVHAALREVRSSKTDVQQADEADRDLQAAAEVCGWSPFWRFENDPLYATKNPQKPCLSHGDCAGFTAKAIQAPFQPCCLVNDCICGSTRSEFINGSNRCARFACTTDADCGPGRCVSGRCNFANVEAACRTDADCGGGDNVCHTGVCHLRDPVTGFLLLQKSKSKSSSSSASGSSSGKTKVKEQGSGSSGKTKKNKKNKI